MDGLTISAAYVPSDGTTEVESSSDYGFTFTGIEGLEIGAGQVKITLQLRLLT